jgi:hypothetical protein
MKRTKKLYRIKEKNIIRKIKISNTQKEYQKIYREVNKDDIIAKRKEFYENNKEKFKNYYEENKENMMEYYKKYREIKIKLMKAKNVKVVNYFM